MSKRKIQAAAVVVVVAVVVFVGRTLCKQQSQLTSQSLLTSTLVRLSQFEFAATHAYTALLSLPLALSLFSAFVVCCLCCCAAFVGFLLCVSRS